VLNQRADVAAARRKKRATLNVAYRAPRLADHGEKYNALNFVRPALCALHPDKIFLTRLRTFKNRKDIA